MNIAHYGTFDVDNYGDLLFPLIAEWRIPSHSWAHFSPCGDVPIFSDALKPLSAKEFNVSELAGVMIGGGNIFHIRSSPVPKYSEIKDTAYPSLILGAAKLASTNKVPLIINGPSIRNFKFDILERHLLAKTLTLSSYSAFRDQFSVALACDFAKCKAELIPDTAFDISRMWPISTLNQLPGKGHITVHVNNRYGGDPQSVARAIDNIASAINAETQFLPIGPCHGDIEYMHEVVGRMSAVALPTTTYSLRLFAEQIGKSRAYIGSSMHGFITAISYGVPSLLVLNERPMEKFAGLLDALQAPVSVICSSWEEAAIRINGAWEPGSARRRQIFANLDEHWRQVESLVEGGANNKSRETFRFWRASISAMRLEARGRRLYSRIRNRLRQ